MSEASFNSLVTHHSYIEGDRSKVQVAGILINEDEIHAKAEQCTYLMLTVVNETTYEVHWVEVGCFERFWRWLLSCFGCCESAVEKCKRTSLEIFKGKYAVIEDKRTEKFITDKEQKQQFVPVNFNRPNISSEESTDLEKAKKAEKDTKAVEARQQTTVDVEVRSTKPEHHSTEIVSDTIINESNANDKRIQEEMKNLSVQPSSQKEMNRIRDDESTLPRVREEQPEKFDLVAQKNSDGATFESDIPIVSARTEPQERREQIREKRKSREFAQSDLQVIETPPEAIDSKRNSRQQLTQDVIPDINNSSKLPLTASLSPKSKPFIRTGRTYQYEFSSSSQKQIDEVNSLIMTKKIVSASEGAQINKEVGCFFGGFVGSAIALATQGLNKESAQEITKAGLLYSSRMDLLKGEGFENEQNDHWRDKWRDYPYGGWTESLDLGLLYLEIDLDADSFETILDKQKEVAQSFINWHLKGFTGRDFSAQKGGRENSLRPKVFCKDPFIGAVIGVVQGSKKEDASSFLNNPRERAIKIWKEQGRPATNSALVRSTPVVYLYIGNLESLVRTTVAFCEVTHVDPRCVASCVAMNTALFYLLEEQTAPTNNVLSKDIPKTRSQHFNKFNSNPSTSSVMLDLEGVRQKAFDKAAATLQEKTRELGVESSNNEFLHGLRKAIWANSFEELKLDDNGDLTNIEGTYQCLGVAFAALSLAKQSSKKMPMDVFQEVIVKLVSEGGDSSSNCSVASAALGALLGFSAIPTEWKKLRDFSILYEYCKDSL